MKKCESQRFMTILRIFFVKCCEFSYLENLESKNWAKNLNLRLTNCLVVFAHLKKQTVNF